MTRRGFGWHDVIAATNRSNRLSAFFELLSVPLTYAMVNWTAISANTATRIGGAFGAAGSLLFLLERPHAAGFMFAAFLLLDCSDGALARLRKQTSITGANLDLWTDRIVLLMAALSFSAQFAAAGDALGAWLCMAYLAAHYVTDIGWLIAVRQRADMPPQFEALQAQLAGNPPAGQRWLGWLYRTERSFAPVPWLCNVVFLLGPCFADRRAIGAALAGLLWWILVPRLAKAARRIL